MCITAFGGRTIVQLYVRLIITVSLLWTIVLLLYYFSTFHLVSFILATHFRCFSAQFHSFSKLFQSFLSLNSYLGALPSQQHQPTRGGIWRRWPQVLWKWPSLSRDERAVRSYAITPARTRNLRKWLSHETINFGISIILWGVYHEVWGFIKRYGELKQQIWLWSTNHRSSWIGAGHFPVKVSVLPPLRWSDWLETSDWCPLLRCRSWPSSDLPGHLDWRWKPTGAVNSHELHLGQSRLVMVNPHSPHYYVICTVSLYCVILCLFWGIPQRDGHYESQPQNGIPRFSI